jgi:hypothetical protein
VQDIVVPATQAPCWQVSLEVQAFPSLQLVPSVASAYEHVPSVLHVPTLQAFPVGQPVTAQLAG